MPRWADKVHSVGSAATSHKYCCIFGKKVLWRQQKSLSMPLSSMPQLAPSPLRHGCLLRLHLWVWMHSVWLEKVIHRITVFFKHPLWVLTCFTPGSNWTTFSTKLHPVSFYFSILYFQSGIYIRPLLWFLGKYLQYMLEKCLNPGFASNWSMSVCLTLSHSRGLK